MVTARRNITTVHASKWSIVPLPEGTRDGAQVRFVAEADGCGTRSDWASCAELASAVAPDNASHAAQAAEEIVR